MAVKDRRRNKPPRLQPLPVQAPQRKPSRISETKELEFVLSGLERVRRSGTGYMACCPVHEDRNPSLSVRIDDNGRVRLKCFAGCDRDEINAAVGLEEHVCTYNYTDEAGAVLFQKRRYQRWDDTKDFRLCRLREDGSLAWSIGDVRRVLYQAAEVRDAIKLGTVVYVVEGEKDADRLRGLGLCATTNFEGAGPTKWRPEYTESLRDADVVVLPDNDKPGLAHARNVAAALHPVAKRVRLVELPGLKEKEDVSDWLDAGRTIDQLRELVDTAPDYEPALDSDGAAGTAAPLVVYAVRDGVICRRIVRGDTTTWQRLCNFEARIVEQIRHDDGSDNVSLTYTIHSPQHGELRGVDATKFGSLEWASRWGAKAIVAADLGARSHLPVAIQTLSQDTVISRTIYTHLGWRNIDGIRVYLHADGAIGAAGSVEGIAVEPVGSLADYGIDPPTDTAACVRAAFRFLEIGPAIVTYPLLAAAVRAPLAEFLPASCSVFVVGDTGVLKSAVLGVLQSFYGTTFANGKHFPANWSSTANSLERVAFLAKDALVVIDDFVPKGSRADTDKLHQTAERVLRGQGNLAGRQRMRADTSLRTEYFPRGLIAASGEDLPRGRSLVARLVVLQLAKGDVDTTVLTELQKHAADGLLAGAMHGYLRWLAPRGDVRRLRYAKRQQWLRAKFQGSHARTPENAAQLYLGMEEFLRFALDVGALDLKQANFYARRTREVLIRHAMLQDIQDREENPVPYFFDLLGSVLLSGMGHVADVVDGREPGESPERYGWEQRTFGAGEHARQEWVARGERIGWVRESADELYLDHNVAFATVSKLAERQARSLGVQPRTLWKRLSEQKLLKSSKADRNLQEITVVGVKKTVLHLSLLKVLGERQPSEI
jgi:hypothetical protein